MMKHWIVVAFVGAAACGDGSSPPEPHPSEGVWQVTAIDGHPLPASSLNASEIGGVPITVTGGVLVVNQGGPWWETCLEDSSGTRSHFVEIDGVGEIDDSRIQIFYHNIGAGSHQPDTLTVNGDQATLRYRETFTPETTAEAWLLKRIGDDPPNACSL